MNYYKGKHAILNETKKNRNSPNNKIITNMCKYITDTATGYFLGQPIVYSSSNTKLLEEVQKIFDYNDEQDENAELAKWNSIYGSAVEMLYLDEDGIIRFTKINPSEIIFINETMYGAPLAVIRKIVTKDIDGKETESCEFWNKSEVWTFEKNGGSLSLIEAKEHYFNDVPFIEFINNEERIGDFEGVISLNDAYNKVQSNTANFFQYNDDAILKISRIGNATAEDIKQMREDGAIVLDDGGDIDWLFKIIDDSSLENYKTRIKDDIHNFSNVPNLNDDKFGGNTSGVAIDYKLWGLEQVCAIKERKFKKAIQRRIELITNVVNIKGGNYSYMDIKMQFRRNKPQNLLELVEMVMKLSGELSLETRLQLLPFIESVKDELERIKRENKETRKSFGNSKETNNHFEVGDEP